MGSEKRFAINMIAQVIAFILFTIYGVNNNPIPTLTKKAIT